MRFEGIEDWLALPAVKSDSIEQRGWSLADTSVHLT